MDGLGRLVDGGGQANGFYLSMKQRRPEVSRHSNLTRGQPGVSHG
jgi:hypothetical protein